MRRHATNKIKQQKTHQRRLRGRNSVCLCVGLYVAISECIGTNLIRTGFMLLYIFLQAKEKQFCLQNRVLHTHACLPIIIHFPERLCLSIFGIEPKVFYRLRSLKMSSHFEIRKVNNCNPISIFACSLIFAVGIGIKFFT